MILFPVLELRGGRAAYAEQNDPVAVARQWRDAGFRWLHVLDLDGVAADRPINRQAIARILSDQPGQPIQFVGGLRQLDEIETMLALGVERVVLATVARREPALLAEACRRFPGRIAVAIDSHDGVVTDTVAGSIKSLDLALRCEQAGAAAIIYADISPGGTAGGDYLTAGLNLEAIVDLAFSLSVPVIAAGGVQSLDDIEALKAEEGSGLIGVICAKPLYDGRVNPAAARRILGGGRRMNESDLDPVEGV